jgi:hypothetical protein
MAETICPVVDGARLEGHRGSVVVHVVGATSSSALLGAIVAGIGSLLGAPWDDITPAVIVLAAALGLGATWGLPIPSLEGRRQVPEWWRTYFAPRPAAFLYGAALGVGFPFHLRYLTLTCVTAALTATGDVATGTGAMGLFGLFRALSVTPALRVRNAGGEAGDLWLNRSVLAALALAGAAAIVSA